jgi:hypothetical protein
MRVSFGKILGASALLALGTGCGGTSTGGGSSAGGGGMDSTAGSGGAAVGTGAAAGLAGALQGGAGIGGSDAGAAGAIEVGGDAGADTGGTAGQGGFAGGPPVDIGPQKQATKLDVLFVVDNSASMADKQGVLEASLPSFVSRLVNPRCVDAQGAPIAVQPATGAAACASGTRELTPVTDLHLGVITTSIGAHGGTVCSTGAATDHLDDKAQLVPSMRVSVPSFNASAFLSYDATGKAGVTDISSVITDLKATVAAAGETGCGFEAPLEAMYRFLVDPEPPISVGLSTDGSTTTPMGINDVLLAQRAAFLRPDSAVAVVILSDENDCSIRDDGVGWFVGASARMPLSTTACDTNPNDPCCRSCAQREDAPPKGCVALNEDAKCKNVPAGMQYATQDMLHDSLNLRCFHQQARFGFDLLYPVERYSNALSNPKILNRAGNLVNNPLLVGRSATLISVSTIVGTPWQDLASKASLTAGHDIDYLGGAGLVSDARWPVLLGDPANNVAPSDAFMNESITPRSGENPLTHDKIAPASSMNPEANPINGHEQNLPLMDDLQYACTFPLATPRVCANGDSACDCSADKTGSTDAVIAANSPVCQPPAGGPAGTTQYYAKGYPGARELRLAQLLGERAVPASICPKTLTDAASPDYAYLPAFSALLTRIASTLK